MKTLQLFAFLSVLTLAPAVSQNTHELITWKKLHLTDVFYGEGACFGDVNQDGSNDVISGPFAWLGPDFEEKIEIYEPKPFNPKGYSDNFFSFTHDLNGDGWLDVLVIGFPGKEARWYENPKGAEGHWPMHVAADQVDNESPWFTDLTGDSKPEIVCSQNGQFGYYEPNWEAPTDKWTWHPISPENATGGKFTHGLGVGDVNGDGRLDLLEKGRWWEQPENLEGDPEWESHRTGFSGGGGAQMYAYDFDGDGDNDILTSLAAHGYGFAWYEQLTKDGRKTLEQRLIMGQDPRQNDYGVAFSQLHGIDIADVNGDGLKDVVTGKRFWAHNGKDPGGNDPAVLYWFETKRTAAGAEFVPHQIDDNSGVGTEVKAGDVNGDGLVDVVVGNKKGTFVHLQQREKVDEQTWKRAQPVKTVIHNVPKQDDYVAGRSPEDAVKAMSLPEGFNATLIASEPDLAQPVTFCFDERGRIWVAEANTYPTPAPEGEGKDRILIFEDADHDGSYETKKIFMEGLNLVSGLEVGFGGVWVGAAPYFMFIPDRNRDDVPDSEPEILLDGWGTQDTHETLNSFTWGPDGWLYGCHGVFTHSNVGKPGTPEDERTFLNCAVWRFHPVNHAFEVFAHGTSNPWGLDFDEYGQAFISACVIPHLWHMVQGAYYERQGGQHKRDHLYELIGTIARHRHFAGGPADHAHWGKRRDAKADIIPQDTFAAGGGHAHCGLSIYLGDNFPQQYRGALLMHNLHGHRVNWDFVAREGSGYYGDRRPDLMFANDHWYVGTDLDYGPDGALYAADWHDDTTCHRRDDLEWDRTNGRLYRIHFGELEPVDIDLYEASDEELIAYHTHENEWYVRTARRILQERVLGGQMSEAFFGDGENNGLTDLVKNHPDIKIKLRALWTLHATGFWTDDLVAPLLKHENEYIRAWVVRFLGEDFMLEDDLMEPLVGMAANDPSPLVRRHLASLVQRLPIEQAWPIAEYLTQHTEDADDHVLPKLLWYGMERLVAADPVRGLEVARLSEIPKISEFIYRRTAADSTGYAVALQSVLKSKRLESAKTVVAALAANLKDEATVKMPESWPAVYDFLKAEAKKDAELQRNLFVLAGKFQDQRLLPEFRQIVADSEQPVSLRKSALETLVMTSDSDASPVLRKLVRDVNSPLREEAIDGLNKLAGAEAAPVLIEAYPTMSQPQQAVTISALTARKDSAMMLLEAIGSGKIPRSDVSVVAARQILQFEDPDLNAALDENWGAVNPVSQDKAATIAEYKKQFGKKNLARANLGNGRRVYNQTCYACHKFFGEGNEIGPDITGANRSDLGYLLENLIDPSALVAKEYFLTVFTLKDGSVISGTIKGGSDTGIRVALPGGAETIVARDEIAEQKTLQQSLMPPGILESLPENDARDLIAYLQSDKQVRLSQPGEVFLEGEGLEVLEHAGQARDQMMSNFNLDSWSGNSHLWWTGGRPGDRMILEFEVPEAGTYKISTSLTKAHDYGQVRLKLDGQTELIDHIDLYEPKGRVVTTGELALGSHELSAGKHRLIVDILGANPKATKGYMFGIDYLSLAKQ